MTPAATILAALGFLLLAQDARPPRLELRVASEGWGPASSSNVEAVLRSAAETLLPSFPGLQLPVIDVARSQKDPITLYQRGPAGEMQVRLNVEGFLWARFAFQFSHELAHVLCGVEEFPNPNMWFEESLCEVASLYALGRMAESWKTKPPFENWKSYSPHLKKYRDDRIEKECEPLPDGLTLQAWFREKEPKLRADAHLRAANLTIAAALLPLFEAEPAHWEALRSLNAVHGDGKRTFARYLGDWTTSAPVKHREFIGKIAARLGVTVDR